MRSILVAIAASLLFAGTAHAQELLPDSPVPYTEFGRSDFGGYSDFTGTLLYQTNPRWRNMRLGSTTVGKSGCLVLVFVDIGIENGYGDDPFELLKTLTSPTFVDRRGNFRTGLIGRAYPGMFVENRYPVPRNFIDRIAGELNGGSDVAIKLAKHGGGTHWVRAKQVVGNDIVIYDPAYRPEYLIERAPDKVLLKRHYGSPRVGSEVLVLGKEDSLPT